VAVYRKDGRSCGSQAIPMVNFIYDMQWDFEKKPRLARGSAGSSSGTWMRADCGPEP